MTPEEITSTLTKLFGSTVQAPGEGLWQVEEPKFRILVLLSDDQSWLRAIIPITRAEEAQPFIEQILEANFDQTQDIRYAFHQEVLWGVFQHNRESLTVADFNDAIARLLSLNERGLSDCFNQFVEARIQQIVQVAKVQGQSLEATMQTLDRFYEEGLMGELDQGSQAREQVLAIWRRQLERLWTEA